MLRHASHIFAPNLNPILLALYVSLPVFPFQAAPAHQFTDSTPRTKISFGNDASRTGEKYLLESMTGGVALFDFDRDGRLDIYFVNGAALPANDKADPRFWNRLYQANPDGTYIDVTEKSGVRGRFFGMGAVAADFDNDGWPDLYVTNYGGNVLYRNNGDGTFRDVTAAAGVDGSGWSTGAAFVDYDRDGFVDLVVARYVEWSFSKNPYCGERKPGYRSYCHPDQFQPATHLLFRNNGDGTFTDVSSKSGLAKVPGKGLGVAVHDYNRDGWPDVAIANDSAPQQLFRNRGDGTFEDTALLQGAAYDDEGRMFAGMGIDFADMDNDGWPDLFINALANQKYALFRNVKDAFEYTSGQSGVARATLMHSGWGAKLVDVDNDGWKDLFVAQGHVMDNIELTQPHVRYLEPPLLMRNQRGKFADVSKSAGPVFLTPLASRGAAFGDLDNDGAMDVVINNNDGPPLVLRNSGTANQWIGFELTGVRSNRDAIGAEVRVVTAAGEQHAFVSPAGSYLSSNDPRLFFGLSSETVAKLVEIRWPSGTLQKMTGLPPGRIIKVKEPAQPGASH